MTALMRVPVPEVFSRLRLEAADCEGIWRGSLGHTVSAMDFYLGD